MVARTPLILLGMIIAELRPGDSVASVSKNILITNRLGLEVKVTLENSPYIAVGKRDGSSANVILEI